MIERNKVIEALKRCIYDPDPGQLTKEYLSCSECPYCHGCTHDLMRDALALLKEQEPHVMTLEELQTIETPWNRNTPPYLWLEDRFGQNSHWMCWRDIHSVVSSSEGTVWKQNYGSMRRVWTLQPTPEQMRETPWEGEEDHEA